MGQAIKQRKKTLTLGDASMIVHLKTGWLEAHFIGFIGKKRKELSN